MNEKSAKLIKRYARLSGQEGVERDMKRVWDTKNAAEKTKIRVQLEKDIELMRKAKKDTAAQEKLRQERLAGTASGTPGAPVGDVSIVQTGTEHPLLEEPPAAS